MDSSTVTYELAAIKAKVNDLRIRSDLTALARGGRGAAWTWFITLLLFGGLALLIPMPGFVRASLIGLQLIAMSWVFWRTCLAPTFHRWRTKNYALYCEELEPRLDKRLVTCLDIAAEPDGSRVFGSSPVAGLLLSETAFEMRGFDPGAALSSRRILRYLAAMLLPGLLLGLTALVIPAHVGALFTALYKVDNPITPLLDFRPGAEAGVTNLFLEPGSLEIPRGGNVEFIAVAESNRKRTLDEAPELHILQADDVEPSTHRMLADDKSDGRFRLATVDVQRPFVYHATVLGLRTPDYTVTVYDAPKIARVSSIVTPPAYTGLAAEEVAGTFIAAYRGSTIAHTLESDKPLMEARLQPEKGPPVMGVVEGHVARFEFGVDGDMNYRGIVVDTSHHLNSNPPLIELEGVQDEPPSIRIKRPGADWALHPIGEMELRVEVDDEFGLRDVTLEYQINDGVPQHEVLLAFDEAGRRTDFDGDYTFYLEDLDVEVGDVVLYRLQAHDRRPDESHAWSVSQPYFLTIRPYEQDFFAGGSGGGGEAAEMPNQKEVIIATTRLIDRERDMETDLLAERSVETADTQRVIEDRTRMALRKMRAAQVPNRPDRVHDLEEAIEDMKAAEELLESVSLREALASENAALSHLLAAFAGLPKGVPGGGGGGGGARMDLLGQKLDRKAQKYETMDGLPVARTRQLDEAIAKTKILAQRQKEFAETIRREREQSGRGGGGMSSSAPSSSSQQSPPTPSSDSPARSMVNREEMLAALAESQRELAKLKDALLNRLELNHELSKDLEQALRNAAQEMKRLNNALGNDDLGQAQGANTRALEQMRQIQLRLQQAKLDSQSDTLETLIAEVEGWRREQERLNQSTAGLRREQTPAPGQSNANPMQLSRGELVSQQDALSRDALETSRQVGAMTPMADDPNPPDYFKLEEDIATSGRTMRRASVHLEFEDDLTAERQQLDVLQQLERLSRELEQHIEEQSGQDLARLRQALAAVRDLQEEINAELTRMNSGPPSGQIGSDTPLQTAAQGGLSPSQPPGGPPSQSGASGTGSGGTSRIGGKPENQASDLDWPDAGPAATPTRLFDQSALTVQLETIAHLLEPASPALPLVRTLEAIVASDMWTPPKGGAVAGDVEFIGEFAAILDHIEEIMTIELAGEDQLQRLQQAGVEDWPPRFREMASAYFEALAADTQEMVDTTH